MCNVSLQLGLMDVPDPDSPSDGEGDAALEAELLALTGGGGTQPTKRKGVCISSVLVFFVV